MLTSMFNKLFPSIKKEKQTMANSTQYVVYTRNFKSRAKQIGVFAEPASTYKVNGEVHGGKIKFRNLAVKSTARKTATNKLLSKGLDFTIEVLGVAPKNSALTMKSNIISLLKKSVSLYFFIFVIVETEINPSIDHASHHFEGRNYHKTPFLPSAVLYYSTRHKYHPLFRSTIELPNPEYREVCQLSLIWQKMESRHL